MDQPIASEADLMIALSLNKEVNKSLIKINEKLKQLKTIGLTRGDRDILESRLSFVWGTPEVPNLEADATGKQKLWRHTRARQAYTEIQGANDHIFLAVILVIPPTESPKTSFQDVVNHLASLQNCETYRFLLDHKAKKFFESKSAEKGFTGSRYYLRFMGAVFPQGEERVIQFAYSFVRLDDIPSFLETILQGIYSSRLYINEKMQGTMTTGGFSIFVPIADQDGSCNIVVDRSVLINAINKFGLSELKLE